MTSSHQNPPFNLLILGIVVEGGLVILALVLAWFGLWDQSQPLKEMRSWAAWKSPILLGLAATVPMLGYLILFHFWTRKFLQPMQQFVDKKLKPLFQGISLVQMLALSLLAGFGEELFFRWCLQGGVTQLLFPSLGAVGAIAIGVPGMLYSIGYTIGV